MIAARALPPPQASGPECSVKALDPATEHSLLAYARLSKFLQNYIDHVSMFRP